jgi:FKBP-type peptidyl-prolyl cis-trans isomerase FkpA
MKQVFFFLLLLGSILSFSSCSKGEDGDNDIEGYLTKNKITNTQKTTEGIYYIIKTPGNQLKKPRVNSDVRVNYKGMLLNGTVFDENLNIKFNLTQVIAGWTRGIPLFGEGGKGTLIIPANLAYGDTPRSSIPAGSALIFEIDLLEVLN